MGGPLGQLALPAQVPVTRGGGSGSDGQHSSPEWDVCLLPDEPQSCRTKAMGEAEPAEGCLSRRWRLWILPTGKGN